VSGTVLLQAEASDDRGVVEVEFYLDGGRLGADQDAPWSFAWPSASAAPGVHALSAAPTTRPRTWARART
jgi:hypothetical protein